MQVSVNMYKGGEIKDLSTLKELAIEGKSVYIERGKMKMVRPAAFALCFQLSYALGCTFFHTFRDGDITEVEFEN